MNHQKKKSNSWINIKFWINIRINIKINTIHHIITDMVEKINTDIEKLLFKKPKSQISEL